MIIDANEKRKLLELVKSGAITPQEAASRLRGSSVTNQVTTTQNVNVQPVTNTESNNQGIAVIGISGRFPGAKNLDEFWENLKGGVDSVTEIPKERWDIEQFYSPDRNAENKTYCKWGGVLQDVDKFDAEFFNISPKEAQLMDPQQRIVLQEAWKALEDAGYSQEILEQMHVGVFIGATYGDYIRRISETEDAWGIHALTGNQISMLAARISYFLNLTGPNLTIDTACSSSLVAISTACQSLLSGDCNMVVAGGVNVMTTPEMYVMTSKGGMLSPTGKCHAFDNSADGFVPGEGVGIVILKRFEDALKDGDHIYGIIRGSKVNQDGKTNGITAPSMISQHQLECSVYDQYKINPETITYVEAHGTGTKLGDPIEFSALKKSFEKYTDRKNFCGIGAVKSNIGHGMISSGVASLMKVLLCLKYKKLVPVVHYQKLNELIHMEDSPFYVNTEYKDWERIGDTPRRAAISSFGLSGTNCHMVVEEANMAEQVRTQKEQPFYLLMFSANSVYSLKKNIERIRQYIQTGEVKIRDLAYTLSVGRTALSVRTYVIARNLEDAMKQLDHLLQDEFVYIDHRDDQSIADANQQEQINQLVASMQQKEIDYDSIKKLATAFMEAYQVDYYKVLAALSPKRVSLPTYAFEENSYWVEYHHGVEEKKLVDTIEFTGEEFYLKGHKVQGNKVLPGVMYLNLVKTYYEKHYSPGAVEIKDVVWMKPYIYSEYNKKIWLTWTEEDGFVSCEVSSMTERGEVQVHSKCKVYPSVGTSICIDVDAMKERCKESKSANSIYDTVASMGIGYGDTFKVLQHIDANENACIASFQLKDSNSLQEYRLHPAIMDGALQTIITFCDASSNQAYLPYMIQSVQVIKELPASGYISVNQQEEGSSKTFQIELTDEFGNVAVRMNKYMPRVLNQEQEEDAQVNFIERTWSVQEIKASEEIRDVLVVTNQKNLTSEEDFLAFIDSLKNQQNSPKHFVFDGTNATSSRDGIVDSFWMMLHFTKALMKKQYTKGVQIIYVADESRVEQVALEGLFKTIELEQPELACKVVVTDGTVAVNTILEKEFAVAFDAVIVRYQEGKRSILGYKEANIKPNKEAFVWKEDGVYVLTGGAGGIGLHVAKYLMKQHKIHLVLLGRSLPSAELKQKLAALNKMNGTVEYVQCDVSDRRAVFQCIGQLRVKYQGINGVIHSAGVLNDEFILKKSKEQIERTFAPKIYGLINLDEATEYDDLDFFAAFSSIGAITGNVGQCDYTYANSYMDNYILERSKKEKNGFRKGKSLTFNWPLWKNGGMNVDQNTLHVLHEKLGIVPMKTEDGLEVFEFGLNHTAKQIIAMPGEKAAILKHLQTQTGKKVAGTNQELTVSDSELFDKTQEFLRRILAGVIKIEPEKLLPKRAFEYYGIESIMIVSLNEELEKYFGELSKTLFFEYQNLNALTEYFVNNQRDKLVELLHLKETTVAVEETSSVTQSEPVKKEETTKKDQDIAIIGLNGKYPMAENLEVFWENLKEGKDCIEEIPKSRWDYKNGYDTDSTKKGTYNSKWGGFISGVDQFDPIFFQISPKEAEMIDPQERLYLESAWGTFQEAGYSMKALENYKVGVFAGAMYSHYQLFGVEETMKGNPMGLNSTLSSIANRVSYFFNLHGPSMTIDTMCSSSLTAIHLACQSIRMGECEMAIAGGVNLSLHENKYILLGQGNFLASDGRCRSFGAGGDGYVPGEGVGTVLLKSLDQAVKDGDHIYGVIKATAVNHGGKTNGYTVPSLVEQANMEQEVVAMAGIDVNQIGYIETHGTGTSLGDPIEINGLTKALGNQLSSGRNLPIGSVKSNIGHLEAASGIAAITKVIYMMKHKKLVPSLHSKTLNPNINFNQVPFHVQQELEEWKKPVIDGVEKPRLALISSFGAGGANASIVLQEYEATQTEVKKTANEDQLLVLSAKRETSLKEYARRVCEYLQSLQTGAGSDSSYVMREVATQLDVLLANVFDVSKEDIDPNVALADLVATPMDGMKICEQIWDTFQVDLSVDQLYEYDSVRALAGYLASNQKVEDDSAFELKRVAYTLQTGRDEYNDRLAIIVHSVEDAIEKLNLYLHGEEHVAITYKHLRRLKSEEQSSREEEQLVSRAIKTRDYVELARLWTEGYEINFHELYGSESLVKAAIPTTPLERKHCWYNGYKESNLDRVKKSEPVKVTTPVDVAKKEEIAKPKQSSNEDKSMVVSQKMSKEELHALIEREAKNYHGNEVKLEVMDGNIAVVRMEDRENRNQFSKNIIHGLMAKFHEIQQMKTIKAIIITGYDNVFCMGGTKEQLNNIYEEKNAFTDVPFLYRGLLSADVPVISAMQGHAFGGGMLFGLYADMVIMSREAVYSAVFTKYGFTPGMGATYILREKMGNSLSIEMMYTAKMYRGEELERRGANVMFANQKDVFKEALYIARQIADKPRYTLEVLKRGLADRMLNYLDICIEDEERMHRLSFSNPEVEARIKHFYIDSEREEKVNVPREKKPIENRKQIESKQKEFQNQLIQAVQNHSITPSQAKKLMDLSKNKEE